VPDDRDVATIAAVSVNAGPNHYELLGVRVEANATVIRKAWLLAAWDQHPDLHGENERDERTARMRAINEAYQVLSDPVRRRRYDLENGLVPAKCARCGQKGSLRLDERGQTVAVCVSCFDPRSVSIAL
jgi:DnaJ-class molecular chaperone